MTEEYKQDVLDEISQYSTEYFLEMSRREINLLLTHIPLTYSEAILDLGCGTGNHSIALAQKGYRNVVGIDLRDLEEARERGRQETTNPQFVLANWNVLPFEDASFALAITFNSGFSETLGEKSSSAPLELYRVLREGGRVIFDCPPADGLSEAILQQGIRTSKHTYSRTQTIENKGETYESTLSYNAKKRVFIGKTEFEDVPFQYRLPFISEIKSSLVSYGFETEHVLSGIADGSLYGIQDIGAIIIAKKI